MGNVRIWGRENDVAFLAWLDLSLERDFPFIPTAQPILQKYTGVVYSEDQIASRLGTIVRECRNKGYDIDNSELKNEGSSSLLHLDPDMQEEVSVMLEKFREVEVQKKTKRKHVERPIVTLPDPDDSDSVPELNSPPFNKKQETSSRPSPSMISVEIPAKSTGDRTLKLRAENETPANISNAPATTSTKDSVSLNDMRRMHKEVVTRLKAEIAAVRVQWQHAVEDHIQESKRRRQIAADLQAENTHLKTAQLERQTAGKDPLEEVLFRKDQEIWLLKQANHKMRTLATFAGRIEPPRKSLEDNEVGDAIDGIEQELQAILHGHDPSAPLLQPEFGIETDLASLLRAIYREDPAEDESSGHLLKRTVKWGSINVVRSLAVAALNEWVFATDFPEFCSNRTPRLLKAYRDTIFTHDGWTSLHNLELAAYNSLIDSSEFRKITVPRRADELASRFSKALAPLFPRSTDVESNANFEGWNEEQDVCEDRRYRMRGLFEAALRLKAATIMTDERYEFVVHPPGSSITESGTRTAPDLESQDDSGYWLQASIYTYIGEPGDPADPLVNALIQSNNFISNRNNKEERKQCLAEKHLTISKSGDASMDVLGDPGQDMVDVELVDRWAYTDDERLSPNRMTARKRPLKLHAQKSTNKKRKTHHGSEMTPKAGDSDYGEQTTFSSRRYRENEGSGTKARACPRCGGTYDNHGSLLNHIRNQTCVLCIPCDQWFKNSNLFKAHLKEEHTDAFGNVKYDFGNNDGSVNHHGSGDYDQSGLNGSDEDGSNMRTPRNARRPRRSFAISDDSAESEASDQKYPACEYCEKTFTISNLRRHLKNMSCKEHRDAKPDLARQIIKKRQRRDAEFAQLSDSEKPTCEYCGKAFSDKNLRRHLRNMSCKEHRIAEPELAKLHKKRDNNEFAEPSDSDEQGKRDDSARSTCQYCSRSYFNSSSLIRHLKNMSCKEYRDARPDLFKTLNKQAGGQENVDFSELSDSEKHACKFCGRPFMHEVGLRRHLAEMTCKEHQDAEPDLAKELGKVRRSTGPSKPSSSKKRHTCEYCGNRFVDAWGRRRHLINMSCTEHHDAKPALSKELREKRENTKMTDGRRICATCGKIFSAPDYSQHLKRRCNGNACTECDKVFITVSALGNHMLQAHDQVLEPPPTCSDCGQEFSSKDTFARHLKNKPCRECKQCGEWFINEKALSGHQEIHDPDQGVSRRESKAQHRNFRRQESDSSLSLLSDSASEDELSGLAHNSSELVKTRRKKANDISENATTERPRKLSTRGASPKQERSRSPAHGLGLVDYRSNELVSPGQLASPTRLAPDSSDFSQSLKQSQTHDARQRVFSSPTPQESPQRARKAIGTQDFAQATDDELSTTSFKAKQARDNKGKQRERMEVQNSIFEYDANGTASSDPEVNTEPAMFKDKVSSKLKSSNPSNLHLPSNDSQEGSRPDLQAPREHKSGSRSVFSGQERGM